MAEKLTILLLMKRMCDKSVHIHQQQQSTGQNVEPLNEEGILKVVS